MKNLKDSASIILMLLALTSMISFQSARTQPVRNSGEPSENSPADTSTIAPSGVGTAESAVAYPHKVQRGRVPTVKNQLDLGSASQIELAAISHISLPKAFSPRQAIGRFVEKLAPKAGPPILQMTRLQFLEHAELSAALSDSVFYSLRFPQWPIAFAVPEPLRNNNVFVFNRSAKLILITKIEDVEKLFREHIQGVRDAQSARTATTAFLQLAEEINQDGMYQFSIPDSEIKVQQSDSGIAASGKATVKPVGGNAGEITAKLIFNPQGNLVSATQSVDLKQGMRPICQSTKLLDPDPIVRRMAEQDLLIMGKAAKPYLDEQRMKVSPELQRAIDKVWRRIQIEDR